MKKKIRHILLISIICLFGALPALSQQDDSEAAKKHFQAGIALIEKAEKPSDFLAAMTEFEEAATIAPMWPDIHYNIAMLAAETDKPAKAIKEYQVYLTLSPKTQDRAKIEGEIVRMNELIARKRKIGLPGVKFASMKDGIAVLEVYPGAKVTKTSFPLRKGHKIVAVNNISVVGMTLDDFFKTIEKSTQDARQTATTGRLYARGTKATKDDRVTGELVMLKVKYPTIEKEGLVPMAKEMFRSRILEIEEDEFDAEVLKEKLPVLVMFWRSDCEPCKESIPIIEDESGHYAGRVKFVNINADDNKKLVKQLTVREIPTLMVYKNGAAVTTNSGKSNKSKITELLRNAADK